MSLTNIYPYFRERMNVLGFTEWPDGFNRDNIPSSVIDKSYHILTPTTVGGPVNQNHQDTATSVSIQFVVKGYRDPTAAKERSLLLLENIIKDICNIRNRTATLLNVVYEGSTMEALSVSDDNQVLVDVDFTAFVVLSACDNID